MKVTRHRQGRAVARMVRTIDDAWKPRHNGDGGLYLDAPDGSVVEVLKVGEGAEAILRTVRGAAFISLARDAVPKLLTEIRLLRTVLHLTGACCIGDDEHIDEECWLNPARKLGEKPPCPRPRSEPAPRRRSTGCCCANRSHQRRGRHARCVVASRRRSRPTSGTPGSATCRPRSATSGCHDPPGAIPP